MKLKFFLIATLLFVSNSSFADKLPNIVILATGGTIAGSAANDAQTVGYKAGAIGVEKLINAVPEINKVAHVTGEQIANIGSENMTSDVILKLSNRVNDLLSKSDVDGVVITHGTDTLDETSYFLNLTVKSNKPVVFTAAMRPATAISADGPMNLLSAVTVASDKKSKNRGVLVVLNNKIGAARFITKTNTSSIDAFKAPEEGYIGSIIDGNVEYFSSVEKKHTSKSIFNIGGIKKMPSVDIIYGYQDDPEYMFDAAIKNNVKGIVFAGAGAGSVSVRSEAGIKKAQNAGIIVVRASRTGSGIVPKDDTQPGLVSNSLNPAKARILLMLALSITDNDKEIQKFFYEY
ncbi:type II asparaginase [Acinetobacter pittii]|uniref:type II asparaginase n=1 Tax=Acinetobacter pittii TaxID=48296 RepID=UPI002A04411C|nr:type II asparaginase [Acinetobacter pittii]MDX8163097.1 type II asparaginase [Acinetobacter pittii]